MKILSDDFKIVLNIVVYKYSNSTLPSKLRSDRWDGCARSGQIRDQ